MGKESSIPKPDRSRSKSLVRDLLLLMIGILLGGISTYALNSCDRASRQTAMRSALLVHAQECGIQAQAIRDAVERYVIPNWQKGFPQLVTALAKIDTTFWHSVAKNPDDLPSGPELTRLIRFYMRAERANATIENLNALQCKHASSDEVRQNIRHAVLVNAWKLTIQFRELERATSIQTLNDLPDAYADNISCPPGLIPPLQPAGESEQSPP